jgi:hypothetical protein
VEAEETETVAVAVKMAVEAIEMAAMMVNAAATLRMAAMGEAT